MITDPQRWPGMYVWYSFSFFIIFIFLAPLKQTSILLLIFLRKYPDDTLDELWYGTRSEAMNIPLQVDK